jgi:hypothetical protein
MADDTPDKIIFGIGNGRSRAMVRLPDGSYADRVAISAGAGLVTDESGQYTFDLSSLASRFRYDEQGNQVMATYGPDQQGRFIRQTSVWENGMLMGESAWFMVDSMEAP